MKRLHAYSRYDRPLHGDLCRVSRDVHGFFLTKSIVTSTDGPRTAASGAGGGQGEEVAREIPATTLDQGLGDLDGAVVLLIDVEGGEARVLRGAREFLRRCVPLVIFEYNSTSRKHFDLDDIRVALGEGYDIYRLTGSGTLDLDFERAWNCVAVSATSPFKPLCSALFRPAHRAGRSA